MPDTDANALLLDGKRARPRSETRTILSNILPARFAAAIAGPHLLPARSEEFPTGNCLGSDRY